MAAVELKKQHWNFDKKYKTWFKLIESDNGENKYMYFDYEVNWQIRESDSSRIDPSQFETELVVPRGQ